MRKDRFVLLPKWVCTGVGIMLPMLGTLMGWVVLSVSSMQAQLNAHLEHSAEFRAEVRVEVSRLEARIRYLEQSK